MPTLAQGGQAWLIRIEHPSITAHCLEPNDAAISKLARGEPPDLRWVRAGLQAGLVSLPMLRLRARSTGFLDAAEQSATLQRSLTWAPEAQPLVVHAPALTNSWKCSDRKL